jgi:hypothetical protein
LPDRGPGLPLARAASVVLTDTRFFGLYFRFAFMA